MNAERTVASGDFLNNNRTRRVVCLPGHSGCVLLIDPSTPVRQCTKRYVEKITILITFWLQNGHLISEK